MTSATDHLIEGITGLTVIAIKQISTFISKRFRNITLFNYPYHWGFFSRAKRSFLPLCQFSIWTPHRSRQKAKIQTFAEHLSEAVDAILPSKNIIDRFLRAGELLALASLFMRSSRMTPRDSLLAHYSHFGSYLHYDKNKI